MPPSQIGSGGNVKPSGLARPGPPEHLEKPTQEGLGKRAHLGGMNQVPDQRLQHLHITNTLGGKELPQQSAEGGNLLTWERH